MGIRNRVGQGGTGPGPISPDGSPIELYERVEARGEDQLINAVIPPRSSILELGCGIDRRSFAQDAVLERLTDQLRASRLELVDYLTPDRTWIRARPQQAAAT